MGKTAAICNACNTELKEGGTSYYDDYKDAHYCNRSCFTEWYLDNAELMANQYAKLNCERVDL